MGFGAEVVFFVAGALLVAAALLVAGASLVGGGGGGGAAVVVATIGSTEGGGVSDLLGFAGDCVVAGFWSSVDSEASTEPPQQRLNTAAAAIVITPTGRLAKAMNEDTRNSLN